MIKPLLRNAAIVCLLIWAAIWLMFMLMRFSSVDIRGIPNIGIVMLSSFAVAMLAPLVAAGLAGAAVFRQPRARGNVLVLGCAIAALVGQALLFLVSKWM